MFNPLPISFVSALAWAQVVKSAPADPTITPPAILPRQNADNFIGWLSYNGTWGSEVCDPGATWYQDGSYAQCCPTSLPSCSAPTACVSGSLIYPLPDQSTTSTIACTENYNDTQVSMCNTVFIYENTDDSSPQTDIVCGAAAVNWSYYRSIAASLTETSLTPTTTTSSASSQTSSETASSTPASGKEGSKAWIAGAVVGPIVGLALVGAIIFFLLRRKRNKPTPEAGTATAPPGVEQYSDTKPVATSQGAYNPEDPYNQYGQVPAPQYSAPYQGAYAPGQKDVYQRVEQDEPPVAGLGDAAMPGQSQVAELGDGGNATNGSRTAELSGETTHR
ncbi:hypothetical protein K491DRAFT_717973 [Lophiostoma macrostomum CBS 122681]|uniref:Mid2 domain-containing protein n=1 Tax=Lophiostoma macrostomum CBS 122681 TaxID=1314788 RepID=A0A6A6T3S4_9PLEO|nr:hypothetical protein K491DRAFT_717973 [Lophiostoma macrostomum CBS 122681]